jgi:hypothetical protein
MGDLENIRGSAKSLDEKNSFEDTVTPTTWTTSAANVTRLLSEKLSAWGVEERGAYRISTLEVVFPDQRTLCVIPRTTFARLPLDRHPPRRRRGQDRNTFHQNILHMVFCEYKHPVVRVPFPLIALVTRDLHFGSFVDSP